MTVKYKIYKILKIIFIKIFSIEQKIEKNRRFRHFLTFPDILDYISTKDELNPSHVAILKFTSQLYYI
jgi:hypothetical protein